MVVHNLRSWISRAKLDVDQVCVFLDARMVEVYLLEQLLAMHARLPHRAHVSAVEGSDADGSGVEGSGVEGSGVDSNGVDGNGAVVIIVLDSTEAFELGVVRVTSISDVVLTTYGRPV